MNEEVKETTITVPLELFQAVFDIATGSMDFGSGCLDNHDVDQLCSAAALLDLDPIAAIPRSHMCARIGGCQKHYHYPKICRICLKPMR